MWGVVLVLPNSAQAANGSGDLNGDNKVDISDVSQLLSKFGSSGGAADLNNSGIVDVADLSILLSNFGNTVGTGTLVWSDEFNGSANVSPDSSKWTLMNWCDNWGSLSCNTSRTQNVSTDGAGHLKLTAIKENYTDSSGSTGTYSASRIVSKYKMLYGTLQASIKMPAGKGLWPAFWGTTDHRASDGAYGEYDISEVLGDNPNVNYCSTHGWSNNNAHLFGNTVGITSATSLASGYHTYEMTWAPGTITYKLDGNVCHTYKSTDSGVSTWPLDTQGNIMFNLAVGGDWPGSPDVNTVFPASMLVDWVRVYN
jgi:beta-glucanase (GH16 family)